MLQCIPTSRFKTIVSGVDCDLAVEANLVNLIFLLPKWSADCFTPLWLYFSASEQALVTLRMAWNYVIWKMCDCNTVCEFHDYNTLKGSPKNISCAWNTSWGCKYCSWCPLRWLTPIQRSLPHVLLWVQIVAQAYTHSRCLHALYNRLHGTHVLELRIWDLHCKSHSRTGVCFGTLLVRLIVLHVDWKI